MYFQAQGSRHRLRKNTVDKIVLQLSQNVSVKLIHLKLLSISVIEPYDPYDIKYVAI